MEIKNLAKNINTIPKMSIDMKHKRRIKIKTSEIYRVKPHLSAKEITAIYRISKLIQEEKNLGNKR